MSDRMRIAMLAQAGLALIGFAYPAFTAKRNESRDGWQFHRSVLMPVGNTSFAALDVPPEVMEESRPLLADLRLVTTGGREVPYVVERLIEDRVERLWSGRLVDTLQERRRRTVWTVDIGARRRFDEIRLEIEDDDFAKRIAVEVSDDGLRFQSLMDDAGVFERDWNPPVRHTTIALPEVQARYVRLTADDRRSPPIRLTSVTAARSRRVAGQRWERETQASPLSDENGVSRYRLDLPENWPAEFFTLVSEDPAFSRIVRIVERRPHGEPAEIVLAERRLYRLRLPEQGIVGESLSLDLRNRDEGELLLEIENSDSPPLAGVAGLVSTSRMRLLFPRSAGSLTLHYGNPRTREPLYDIAGLEQRLRCVGRYDAAILGPEHRNPRFRPEPPLPFAPSRGAPLDAVPWRCARRLSLAGEEDLRSLVLDPTDLNTLRPDLGDLRLVDELDRQVPFILEAEAVAARVDLTIERIAHGRDQRSAISRYRLVAPKTFDQHPAALPLQSLELAFEERFFHRRMRIDIASDGTPRTRRRPFRCFSGVLARGQNDRPERIVDLPGSLIEALSLEIDEGDNAPLTLSHALATLSVPRLTFKAGGGDYLLLLGNARASAPHYDLDALRSQVLALSAAAVTAEPLAKNPRYRRSFADLAHTSPPALLLWIVLVLVVITLLLLTVHVVRRSVD